MYNIVNLKWFTKVCMDILKNQQLYNLYEIYKPILTLKQQNVLDLYLIYDITLAEIANELNITRQAIYNIINDCEKLLFKFEENLRFYDKKIKLEEIADELQKDKMEKYAKSIYEILSSNKNN